MKRPASQAPDLPGYEYVRLLGSGGFSDVFLYEQRLPRRRVAVKVLLTESLTPQTRKQFADEANIMASLSAHPYIVSIFHADVALDGRPYFVMEYCSGPSLAARYKAQPLGIEETLRAGVRLSSAIATAHAAGILHRDIKPANVLMNEYGAPALTDFGISSGSDDDAIGLTTTSRASSDPSVTSGTSVGMSVPWSPPEMFADDPVPDVRSDVFSLAATIYTLLAGHTPFEKPGGPNSQLDLAGRIQRGAMTPLSRSDVPASLRAVLEKGMDSSPERRYARATDFARALQGVEIELGYHPTALEIPNAMIERPSDSPESAAEETRVRGVATVQAQRPTFVPPPAATPHVTPLVAPRPVAKPAVVQPKLEPTEILESTVVRVTAPTVPAAPIASETRRPRRRLPFVIGGAAALVVVGGVVALAVLPRPDVFVPAVVNPSPVDVPGTEDEGPGGTIIKSPELDPAVRSEDGATVTFTWSNPDEQPGDSFLWRRTDGPQDGDANPTSQTTASITGVAADGQICISVWVNRDGQLSADAALGCSP